MIYNVTQIGRLHIELSSRCNASCPACSRNLAGGPVTPNLELTELTLDDIKSFFPEKFVKNIIGINFCGNVGDPGMAVDLLPILEHFQAHGSKEIAQHVRTNGGMRKPDFWRDVGKFFASIPRNSSNHAFLHPAVVWSVDGLEDTNHLYRKGVRWDRLFANMEAYASTGAFGIWEFLVFEHNQHQVEQAERMAEKLGFKFLPKNPLGFGEYQPGKQQGMKVYDKDGYYEYSIYPVNFDGVRDKFPEGYKVDFEKAMIENVPVLNDFSKNLGRTSGIRCKSLEQYAQEIYISATGHLLPCCFLGGVFGQFNSTYSRWQFNQAVKNMGVDKIDLRKNSIYEILMGPHFNKLFTDGWAAKTVEDGRLLFCVETCGSISHMDKLYSSKQIDKPIIGIQKS